jgi:hypothetical protein
MEENDPLITRFASSQRRVKRYLSIDAFKKQLIRNPFIMLLLIVALLAFIGLFVNFLSLLYIQPRASTIPPPP